jgi:hypothetical protein
MRKMDRLQRFIDHRASHLESTVTRLALFTGCGRWAGKPSAGELELEKSSTTGYRKSLLNVAEDHCENVFRTRRR